MKKKALNKKQIAYIEAVVYIIAIIVVIFCKIYGNIYFNLIPLLVILGIIGRCLFKREVITTVFGIITSICLVYTKGQINLYENIIYSMIIGLDIAMGELLGDYIVKSYNEIKKKKTKRKEESKNKVNKKSLKIYLLTIVILFATLFINSYVNGNVFDYIKCKNTLNNYLDESYSSKDNFNIINITYNIGVARSYTFEAVNKNNDLFRFTIYLNNKDIVKDEYKVKNLTKNNNSIQNSLNAYLLENNLIEKYSDISINTEFIEEEYIKINFNKKVENIDDKEKEEFAKKVVEFLKDIKNFEEYNNIKEIQISISNENAKDTLISSIYVSGYEKNIVSLNEEPYKYILKSLAIEYIDSKE